MSCDICGGARVIRLPIKHRLSAQCREEPVPSAVLLSWREYPCPECTKTNSDNMRVASFRAEYPAYVLADADGMKMAKSEISHAMAEFIMAEGMVDVSIHDARAGTHGADMGMKVTEATIGVFQPSFVASIDQRATEKMVGLLGDVAEDAANAISAWNSQSTGNSGTVPKAVAMDYVRKAFKSRIEKVKNAYVHRDAQGKTENPRNPISTN